MESCRSPSPRRLRPALGGTVVSSVLDFLVFLQSSCGRLQAVFIYRSEYVRESCFPSVGSIEMNA